MNPTIFITILGLLVIASAAPICKFSTSTRAPGNGTFNVARKNSVTEDMRFALVDEPSHFGIGKRAIVPIEHLDDPAVAKTTKNGKHIPIEHLSHVKVNKIMEDSKSAVARRDAQDTGVGARGKVNYLDTIEACGKVNCPP